MIKVDIKFDDKLTKQLNSIQQQLTAYPQEALTEFKSLTPIDRGNARRRTTLRNNEIRADYPYAQRLDSGWSKQAPQGMTQPFEQWVRAKVRKIFGK
jgi:hypothetical protein